MKVRNKFLSAQNIQLERLNKTKQNRIFERGNKRLGNQQATLFTEVTVVADLGTTVFF